METEKFKQLIYAKGFNTELTQRLLRIADSSTMMEDLLELIDEENTVIPQSLVHVKCECENELFIESKKAGK